MPYPKQVTDQQLIEAYRRHKSVHAAGRELGIHGSSVHERLVKLGVLCDGGRKAFTAEELNTLRAEYAICRKLGKVKELAQRFGRSYGAVAAKAHELGLSDATDERRWRGTWKYMTKECAAALFERFKKSRRTVNQFCAFMGFDEDSFRQTMRRFFRDEWDHVVESKAPRQSKYRLGRQLEYRVLDELREKGYYALRSPRSSGPVDVVGIHKSLVVFVQCKRSGNISASEWNTLLDLAESVGAIPLLAATPTGRGTVFKRLTHATEKGQKRSQQCVVYEIPYTQQLAY